ncbi:DUF1501 domain-containing protein [Solicola sp. PLA-1-18]|uniref:DUF1501 domain-containing protein n=1 Tax=Solicola sp. PLA-1-18 TaxID=3380532 RepID=UPI003B769AA6
MNQTDSLTPCGDACGDFALSRRSLLRNAAVAGAAGAVTTVFGDAVSQTVFGATTGPQKVLVLLSLRGGADGLSMVVPHAEAAYYAARPQTAIARSSLIAQDAAFGLHPAFKPLEPMWTSGRMAAIQAVGLPAPNRSHFEAMELIEDADPTSSARIGWLNRMIGSIGGADPFEGMFLGGTQTPTSLYGPEISVAANDLAALDLPFGTEAAKRAVLAQGLTEAYAARGDVLGRAGATAVGVADRSAGVRALASSKPQNGASYAGDVLGKSLAQAAAVIRAGVGARAITVDHGSWDHHEGVSGRINTMIGGLAKNLAAFFTDLGSAGSDVTVITLSEFGRRLAQNGSYGLDHGYGNCVLALGGGVRGGRYYGRWPTLTSGGKPVDDLAVTTDFRHVLGEVLDRRFPDVSLSSVFPGAGYSTAGRLGFMD